MDTCIQQGCVMPAPLRRRESVNIVSARHPHATTLMRRLLSCATLLLALVSSPLAAQQKSATASPAAELIRLENQWAAGLVKRDRILFERLLAPRFVYTENDKLM